MAAIEGMPKNISFAVGTGRCGTHFIAEVLKQEPKVAATHERHPFNDTFHRYCKWYGLPIDHAGFLQTKSTAIAQDLAASDFSFEASAYLSLSIQELYDQFQAKFVLLVRSPEKVVNSFLHKGWYAEPAVRADPNLIPSYQNYLANRPRPQRNVFVRSLYDYLGDRTEPAHHFFARIFPSGPQFESWNQMSRIGKLAWYWNSLNAQILEQFSSIPPSHWRVEKLEELSYSQYQKIAEFLGFQASLKEAAYQRLTQSRPGAKPNVPTTKNWTAQEISEFEREVMDMTQKLNYEHRVSLL